MKNLFLNIVLISSIGIILISCNHSQNSSESDLQSLGSDKSNISDEEIKENILKILPYFSNDGEFLVQYLSTSDLFFLLVDQPPCVENRENGLTWLANNGVTPDRFNVSASPSGPCLALRKWGDSWEDEGWGDQ